MFSLKVMVMVLDVADTPVAPLAGLVDVIVGGMLSPVPPPVVVNVYVYAAANGFPAASLTAPAGMYTLYWVFDFRELVCLMVNVFPLMVLDAIETVAPEIRFLIYIPE